jgi:hypothetical protein
MGSYPHTSYRAFGRPQFNQDQPPLPKLYGKVAKRRYNDDENYPQNEGQEGGYAHNERARETAEANKRRSVTPDAKERVTSHAHVNESSFVEDQQIHHSDAASACKDQYCNYCAKDTVTEDNLGHFMEEAAKQKELHNRALKMGRVPMKPKMANVSANNEIKKPDDLKNVKMY